MNILERIGEIGLIPVVVIENPDDAIPAAQALLAAGLGLMEITMRTPAGIQSIKNVRASVPDILVGAGTVLSLEKCKEAVDAGAQFIVSPGINPTIVKWCVENNVVVTPGCVTPTEIETALSLGIKTVKFFPADVYGGVNGCKALYGPYKSAGVKFIPTGGVNYDNLTEFAEQPFIHAVGGGWLCKTEDITNHNFSAITVNVKKSIERLLGFEIAHVGINQDSPEESLTVAKKFNKAFGFPVSEGNSSNFSSSFIEITKTNFKGANGHLAVKTNNISRAIYKDNTIVAVYLREEIAGFAIHLLKK
jgi:2-dehydro-3-deoxyphosphogluconate aldolase/(4S)-4-hydroxy-2-oxoglutarate aldolase